MKVFVVGPIFPFRGGISHSNRLLCENLAKSNDLTAISFSRMYPTLLYPGREQKEAGPDSGFTVPTEHVLDSMNPLTWIGLARRIKLEKPDRVIFHWWHAFFAPMFWTIVRLGRNEKTRFGVVTHNVFPHEKSGIQEGLTRTFFKSIDYFATLCSPDLEIIRRIVPEKPARWFTETTTESQFAKLPDREVARKQLRLASESLLFFGFVRPYKGLQFLLKALPTVLEHVPRLTLMIVGEFWKDKELYSDLINELGLSSHVMIVDR